MERATIAHARRSCCCVGYEEAAAALGIKRAKLYQLIMARENFSVKIGASRRFPVRALEEYVERLCESQERG